MLQKKQMAQKKEPVEIHCQECDAGFRLWIPADVLPEWGKGVRINCIKCGARHFVEKGENGFSVSAVKDAPIVKAPAIAAPDVMAEEAPRGELQAKDTILLIEDDTLSRKMAENAMKDIDVRFLTVKNATEAMKVIRKEKINLIITDLYLKNSDDPESKMDGEDLLKRIVEMGFKIPAIITTGKAIIDDLELEPKWFDLHVKGFIQKGNPFWADELKLKMKEILYKD